MMKFSRAISRVKWFSGDKTNVSKTISVLVFRVLAWHDDQLYNTHRKEGNIRIPNMPVMMSVSNERKGCGLHAR
jgi:hypothetical protein